jgi:hypothetical protein
MAKDAVSKRELELGGARIAEAAAADLPDPQLAREFIRDFARRQREAPEHDAWFRREVEQVVRESDDPILRGVPYEEVPGD